MTAPDLLEELYRDQQRSMRSLAWMLLGDQESAEDAVQDCFSRLELRSLAGIDNPAAYLRTCVVNQCRSVMRTRSRFDRRADPPPALHHDPTTVEFHDALLNLTSRRRTAVVLRYWCDLPVIEIADLMGCRPSTVSSLLHRALNDLKEVL